MGKIKDISGQKFGRWTVCDCAGRNKSGGLIWLCVCDCGTKRIVDGRSLRCGASKSCGCLSTEEDFRKNKKTNNKHTGRNERLYGVWHGIKDRCCNPNSKHYYRYGGRGINICDQWRNSYAEFREWAMTHGYDPKAGKYHFTIDRINNEEGYSPENCRIVSQKSAV